MAFAQLRETDPPALYIVDIVGNPVAGSALPD
jgi:hypothetical protein